MSLNVDNSKNTLVIGIGNPLRNDDGVGPYVADSIEAKGLGEVKVWITQQLYVEDLDRMLAFKRIILVDAAIAGAAVDFRRVEKSHGQLPPSSHHLTAEMFVNLASSIYHQDLNLHLCSIRGYNFDVGNKLSTEVLKSAQDVVQVIIELLKEVKVCTKDILPNKL